MYIVTFMSFIFARIIVVTSERPIIKLGFILNGPNSLLGESNLRPPVDIALDDIEGLVKRGLYLNFTLSYVFRESTISCNSFDARIAGGLSAELYYEHKVFAFIGPPCTFDMISTADLAAYWNLPVLVGAGVSGTLEAKSRYLTLTRTAFRSKAIANFVKQIFDLFRWMRCAILVRMSTFHSLITVPDIMAIFEASFIKSFAINGMDYESVHEMVSTAAQKARSRFYRSNICHKKLQHVFQRRMIFTFSSHCFPKFLFLCQL